MRLNTICCIGAEHVGVPACCVMALQCPEIRITVLDNEKIIAEWNSSKLPIFEPELDSIVRKCRNRNLFFSSDYSYNIKEADLVFISIKPTMKKKMLGEGNAVDLKPVLDAAKLIALNAETDTIVVEKSMVPLKAAENISTVLESNRQSDVRYQVLSNPEFFTEGSAVADLLNPQRVIIGCQNNPNGRAAAEALCAVYERWIPRKNIVTLNTWGAELSKLASSAFLAQRLASVNALTEICEATGADISEILTLVGKDSRIGADFVHAPLGFGAFQKEISALAYVCDCVKLPEVAVYWRMVLELIEHHKKRFIEKIKTHLEPVAQTDIAVWGFTYKENTSEMRYSPAIDVCRWLVAEKARIKIYDPQVHESQIWKDLRLEGTEENRKVITICDDPYEAIENTRAIIICTEWDEFNKIDYQKVVDKMHKPAYIIDGRKFLMSKSWSSGDLNITPPDLSKSKLQVHIIR